MLVGLISHLAAPALQPHGMAESCRVSSSKLPGWPRWVPHQRRGIVAVGYAHCHAACGSCVTASSGIRFARSLTWPDGCECDAYQVGLDTCYEVLSDVGDSVTCSARHV
jgi:hypothetical protein